jgi:hypothetical protein
MAEPGRDGKPRRRSRRGRGEESDGCTVPVKPRTKPTTNRWRRWWREGGRPEGRRAATHAPDSVPDTACNRSCEPADWGCMGRQSPEPQSRSTFGRSPVRESRTPGSARGGRGNPVPYRYRINRGRRGSELPLKGGDGEVGYTVAGARLVLPFSGQRTGPGGVLFANCPVREQAL